MNKSPYAEAFHISLYNMAKSKGLPFVWVGLLIIAWGRAGNAGMA
jgi:hypothetical protein